MKWLAILFLLLMTACDCKCGGPYSVTFQNGTTVVCKDAMSFDCGMRFYGCSDGLEHRCTTNAAYKRIEQ
jgi:hypothetical protein